MLMTLSVTLCGASHLAVRAPAVLGTAVYLVSMYVLVRRIGGGMWRQWTLLACLAFNPFVADYLVAARGYSLALGFFGAMLAVLATEDRRPPLRTGVLLSLLAALAFLSQFAFAIVAALLVLLGLIGAVRRRAAPAWRLAAAYVFPGIAVAAAVAGPMLLGWPQHEDMFGARSLAEMLRSLVEMAAPVPNPHLLHPVLVPAALAIAPLLYPLLAACMALRFRVKGPMAGRLARLLAATVAVQWLVFRLTGLVLPKERTGVYFVPLFLLLAGALAAPAAGRWSRRAITAALVLVAGSSLLCLRLTWFQQWDWGADARQVYAVLSWYNHRHGVRDVATAWRYTAALNFYRVASGREDLKKFEPSQPPAWPEDAQAWVLYWPDNQGFVEKHGLDVVYRGERTQTIVAVRPEFNPR
jgi:hypothetical protein